jgi:fatty acid desaturase
MVPSEMPTGDSPRTVHQYYEYLQGHQETMQAAATWHVRWVDLAWLWGFMAVLSLIIIWWVWQYRSTRQKAGLYPVDEFGGYTSELAGPATLFFLLLCAIIAAFAVVLIVGHLVWGQKF